ncbi:MAG: hypothetical protein IT189_08460 [Microbacteriaceae bacterium]|jgi:hypothetical protein|nr:hypothetical protein [Microbacteriaceae bacterium]
MITVEAVVAVISASVTAIVAVVLFFMESRRRAKEARQASRRDAIRLALDAMDGVTRRAQRLVILRLWTQPELEFALVVPRLLVSLEPQEIAVAKWALRQVSLMGAARSDQEVVRIGVAMTLTLTEWESGLKPTAWFGKEVENGRGPQRSGRVIRRLSAGGRLGFEFAVLLVAAASIRYTWDDLRPSELRRILTGGRSRR